MIDLTKTSQLRLIQEDYVKFPHKSHYKMEYVDKGNVLHYINDIKIVLELINEELVDWDEVPNYETILKRFDSNSHCLLFYYNENCIGWNWGNDNVCIDWQNSVKELPKGELYAGGCYVSRLINRPADAGLYNYNSMLGYWFNNLGYHTIYGYIDNWNKAAFRVNYQNGFKLYNFL